MRSASYGGRPSHLSADGQMAPEMSLNVFSDISAT